MSNLSSFKLLVFIFIICFFQLSSIAQTREAYLKNFKESFYKDGVLDANNTLVDGKKKGNWKEWYNVKWKRDIGDYQKYHEPTSNSYKNFTIKSKNGKYYRIGYYENDSTQGNVYDFYNSGELFMVGKFANKMKNGKFFYFSKDGELLEQVTYLNDTILKTDTAHYNRDKKTKLFFVYKDGFEWNTLLAYHDNGQLYMRAYFKNKRREGLFVHWTKSGKVCLKDIWHDDKLIKSQHIQDCGYK